MSVSLAIAAGASAQASAASEIARKAECTAKEAAFQPTTATVEQKRDYASCVYTLHGSGEPMDPWTALLLKICVFLVFCGAGVGLFAAYKDDWAGPFEYGFYPIAGAAITAAALFVLGLAVVGVGFLFS
jgi:hypothetical protein